LQQARELWLLSELARRASGSAPYTLGLTVRRGVAEIALATSLQGLALNLPAPRLKPPMPASPCALENQLTAASLADAGAAPAAGPSERGDRNAGRAGATCASWALANPKYRAAALLWVCRPTRARGPASGSVDANLRFGAPDVDAWEAVLSAGSGAAAPAKAGTPKAASAVPGALQAYLPDSFALQAGSLRVAGRTLHDLVVGGSREGPVARQP
jgi:uncharacterized protein YhdP